MSTNGFLFARSCSAVILSIMCLLTLLLCADSANAQQPRTWKDASGKYEVQATFVEIKEGDIVILKKADGNLIQVPLDKLSLADREHAKKLKKEQEDNPFTRVSPGSNEENTQPSGGENSGPRMLEVDFQKAPREIDIRTGNLWRVSVGSSPQLGFKPGTFEIPKTTDFWEKISHVAVNPPAKRAVLTYNLSRPGRRDQASTRMVLLNLETGRVLGNAAGPGTWQAMAIHDDGQRIVVQNMSESKETMGQLGTIRLQGKTIKPLDLWTPYRTLDMNAKEKIVRFAQFINDGRLLTVCQCGRGVIWDFESREPLKKFQYHGACQPTLSHDRKFLAICGGGLMGIIPLDEDTPPSIQPAEGMNFWIHSALSPSGKHFAATTLNKLMIWDIETGKVLFEGPVNGVHLNNRILFPTEELVLLGNEFLFEWSSGIKVWQYSGAAAYNHLFGLPIFAVSDRGSAKLMPIELPHPQAKTQLERARRQSDLFVWRKGARVAIDTSQVPARWRREVDQALRDQVAKLECRVDQSAPVRLVAQITGPKARDVSYTFGGTFTVQEYKSVIWFEYRGKTLWRSSATNVPGVIGGSREKSMQQQIDEASRRPNTNYYSTVGLPGTLQKPVDDGTRSMQTLGISKITINGLK